MLHLLKFPHSSWTFCSVFITFFSLHFSLGRLYLLTFRFTNSFLSLVKCTVFLLPAFPLDYFLDFSSLCSYYQSIFASVLLYFFTTFLYIFFCITICKIPILSFISPHHNHHTVVWVISFFPFFFFLAQSHMHINITSPSPTHTHQSWLPTISGSVSILLVSWVCLLNNMY